MNGPAGGGPGSINLSHAVTCILYELFQQAVSDDAYVRRTLPDKARDKSKLLNTKGRERLQHDLLCALKATAIVDGESWDKAEDSHTGFKDAHERRWNECLSRLLSAGPIDEGDAGVLFRLARRVSVLGEQASGGTWLHEKVPLLRSALSTALASVMQQGDLRTDASDETIRRVLRDDVGVALEKRELAIVASDAKEKAAAEVSP